MMWNRAVVTAAGAIAVLSIGAACGGGDSGAGQQADRGSSTSSSATSSATASAAPNTQDHNDADLMFAEHMIPHHQQAVEMSDVVLAKQGVDPRVTDLATRIKAAQGPEIEQMQGWLRQWGKPAMPPMTANEGHTMDGMSGDAMGMMSGEQMTALKNADGAEASKLFLTGMITHHEGAIVMAQTEIKDGTFAPAVELARSIATTQQQEIDTMKGILATL